MEGANVLSLRHFSGQLSAFSACFMDFVGTRVRSLRYKMCGVYSDATRLSKGGPDTPFEHYCDGTKCPEQNYAC